MNFRYIKRYLLMIRLMISTDKLNKSDMVKRV